VVRSALQNAASVATLLLTSDALVADAPQEGGEGGWRWWAAATRICIENPFQHPVSGGRQPLRTRSRQRLTPSFFGTAGGLQSALTNPAACLRLFFGFGGGVGSTGSLARRAGPRPVCPRFAIVSWMPSNLSASYTSFSWGQKSQSLVAETGYAVGSR